MATIGQEAAASALPVRSVVVLEDKPLIAAIIQELVAELNCSVVGPAHSLDQAAELIEGDQSYPIAEELKTPTDSVLFTTG